MSDFDSKLDELMARKNAAEQEEKRREEEAAALHQRHLEEVNTAIERAFEGPMEKLQGKLDSLGLEMKVEKQAYQGSLTIRLERLKGPRQYVSLMVISRGRDQGIEITSTGSGSANFRNVTVQPYQLNQEMAERALLVVTEAVMGI